MRKFLVLPLLFLSFAAICQNKEYQEAFNANIPKDLGESIKLPDPEGNGDFNISTIAPYDSKVRVLVIGSDSFYRRVFSTILQSKDKEIIPAIDFSVYELVVYSACGQCLAHCQHDKENASCHRNVCVFSYAWFMRKKVAEDKNVKKLFI